MRRRGVVVGAGVNRGGGQRNYGALMQSYVDAGSVLAWYKAEEASGNLADSSGNAYTATAANLTYAQPGKVGNAVSLNGINSTISGPSEMYAAVTGGVFTFSVWIKTAAWTDGTIRQTVRISTDAADYLQIYRSATNNRLAVDVKFGGTLKVVNIDSLSTTDWFHVLVTAQDGAHGDAMKVFIDGIQSGATQTGFGNWTGTTNLVRFGYNFGTTNVWSGGLDEMLLLKVIPTDDELALLAAGE